MSSEVMLNVARGLMGMLFFTAAWSALASASPAFEQPSMKAAGHTGKPRLIGAVESINGRSVTLKLDSGGDVKVIVPDAARIVRVAPGEKDIASAVPMRWSDVQVGDRILVARNSAGDDPVVTAATVIVMAKADLNVRAEKERQAWQRGVGGIVSAVDSNAGTITVRATPGTSTVIHTSKDTILRRYGPGSIKFADAVPGTLDEIKPGDQLRARGAQAGDGQDFAADEVVSGSFQNVAGRILTVDPANHSITVSDLLSKKPVTLKIDAGTEIHQLPEPAAQAIARRLRNNGAGVSNNTTGEPGDATTSVNAQTVSNRQKSRGENGGFRPNRPPDLQLVLLRAPTITIANLGKGDAVMAVATNSGANSPATAVTLVGGVEAILTSAPGGSGAATLLSSWNMSATQAEGENQ